MKRRFVAALLIIFILIMFTGCQENMGRLLERPAGEPKLIKVEIVFTDDKKLVGYVKNLGVEDEGKVYVGGSSRNYLYDAAGNIIGSFNYQRVLYMKILPEKVNGGGNKQE
ncbi:hypothetical protein [Syntrophomonas erecta]